jgi:hypothetical protein
MALRTFTNFNYREVSGLDGKDAWHQSNGVTMHAQMGCLRNAKVCLDILLNLKPKNLSFRQKKALQVIIFAKPDQELVHDALNLCNLFCLKVITSVFLTSASGSHLSKGDCGNSEDIENRIDNH